MNQLILTGYKKNIYHFKIWWNVTANLFREYKSPIKVYRISKRALALRTKYTTEHIYSKLAYVNGKVYVNCNNVGWPSNHFSQPVNIEAKKVLGHKVDNLENLRIVQLALTKKCPLNCEHCFEAFELNKKEILTLEDHKKIVSKLQNAGVPIIQFTGGEPMTRIKDLLEILKSAKDNTDFWIYTSGFNLTKENAKKLKEEGLTGVFISIDHHLAEKHNKFRRNEEAFNWAINAAENAINAGLVLAFSVCATKEFTTRENLDKYLDFTESNKAVFMQILEARAEGNYFGLDVSLEASHLKILNEFFEESFSNKDYKTRPIVTYPGYHQRAKGCPGSGSKSVYIDTNGYMNSCPFCRNKKTHILEDNHEYGIEELKKTGCNVAKTI